MGSRNYLIMILFAVLSCLLASCAPSADRSVRGQREGASVVTPSATPALTAARVPASCPVTRPPDLPFTPPAPYPASAPPLYQGFWYGTAALWTLPNADGVWEKLPYTNGVYVQKVFWWRQGYTYQSDPYPNLIVTGKRLDGAAPPLASSGPSNGSRNDIGSFMVVGVDIPTPGCWEITGRNAGAAVRFVVWVAP